MQTSRDHAVLASPMLDRFGIDWRLVRVHSNMPTTHLWADSVLFLHVLMDQPLPMQLPSESCAHEGAPGWFRPAHALATAR
jgi:hypothetical protein